jgi:hypothetical protein
MEKNEVTNIFQDALRKGLILGIIHIIIFLVLYAVDPGKLTGLSTLTITLVINVSYLIYNGIQYRREIGGYMSYGTAFKHAFLIFLTSGILNLIFGLIFIVVDPSLPETLAEAQIDVSVYWAKTMGAPEETLDKMREDMDVEKLVKQYGFLGHLKGFGIVLIFYAVGASLIALITRKNEPELM